MAVAVLVNLFGAQGGLGFCFAINLSAGIDKDQERSHNLRGDYLIYTVAEVYASEQNTGLLID